MTIRTKLQGMAVLLLLLSAVAFVLRQATLSDVRADWQSTREVSTVQATADLLTTRELAGRPDDSLLVSLDRAVARAAATLQGNRYPKAAASLESGWGGLRQAIVLARTDPAARATVLERASNFFAANEETIRIVAAEGDASIDQLQALQWGFLGLQVLALVALWLLAGGLSSTLGRTVATMASTSRQLTVTVEEHERVAAQQATATSQTSTTMEELAASFRLSSDQAETASGETRQVLALSREGSTQVDQTLESMKDLRARVDEISAHILRLSEQVQQIGTINRLVGDLASQTNMLALNAAVEAARAGDAGRGFAVVAAEIRKLADESKRAAERVAHLVSDVQNATHTTVMATEAGTRTVERSVDVAGSTAEVFRRVADSVNNAFDSVQQITLNLRQQAEAVNQVVVAMTSLRNGARDTAAGLSQTREAALSLDRAASTLEGMVRGR